MDMQVTPTEIDWTTLRQFIDGQLRQIAQFDDEGEEYLAVKVLLGKFDEQLGRRQEASPAR